MSSDGALFECVINISEGENERLLRQLEHAAGESFVDRHSDPFHNRSVFTLINTALDLERDVCWLIRNAIDVLDLEFHEGVHPRFGVVDVVPFVAIDPEDRDRARELRDTVAQWLGDLDIPVFLYGDERSLPEVRKGAFGSLSPDYGPSSPNPEVGAVAVGERPFLLAWNMYLDGASHEQTRTLATQLRGDGVRTLALRVGAREQVSCNLIDPLRVGPAEVYDRLTALLPLGVRISECELVGLAPAEVLGAIPEERWAQLGLSEEKTIEFVLEAV